MNSLPKEEGVTKSRLLETVLGQLKETGGIEQVIILSKDGMVMQSDVAADIDEQIVAAVLGMINANAEKAVKQLGHEPLEYTLLSINVGHIIIMGAGKNAILAVLTRENVGLAVIEMKNASEKIAKIV